MFLIGIIVVGISILPVVAGCRALHRLSQENAAAREKPSRSLFDFALAPSPNTLRTNSDIQKLKAEFAAADARQNARAATGQSGHATLAAETFAAHFGPSYDTEQHTRTVPPKAVVTPRPAAPAPAPAPVAPKIAAPLAPAKITPPDVAHLAPLDGLRATADFLRGAPWPELRGIAGGILLPLGDIQDLLRRHPDRTHLVAPLLDAAAPRAVRALALFARLRDSAFLTHDERTAMAEAQAHLEKLPALLDSYLADLRAVDIADLRLLTQEMHTIDITFDRGDKIAQKVS